MSLTLEERERAAHQAGDTELAELLAAMIDTKEDAAESAEENQKLAGHLVDARRRFEHLDKFLEETRMGKTRREQLNALLDEIYEAIDN